MYPMPQMPPTSGTPGNPVQMPPRKGIPTWAILIIFAAVVGLLVLCGSGAFLAISLLHAPTPVSSFSAPTLPAPVGESLTVNNVTVTLASATVRATGQTLASVTLALHFWNQTTSPQTVDTSNWRLYIDGGTQYFAMPSEAVIRAGLQPNQTYDAQANILINAGDHGPYILQTDYTTPQGQPLEWTFTG